MADKLFIRPLDYAQANPEKAYKHTFLHTDRLLVGSNSLMRGQSQPLHDHPDQDKFYLVLAGKGLFTVGEETQESGPGELIIAPAGIVHGVVNEADELLTFLTVIAPFPTH